MTYGFRIRAFHRLGWLFVCGLFVACSSDPTARKERHIARGDEYIAAGKLPEAVIEYRNAVQTDESDGKARVKLAETYVSTGDIGRALAEYVRAADLLPDDLTVAFKAAGLQLLAGRFDEARRLSESILARNPSHVDAQIVLANAMAGLKDFDAAVAEIEEAVRLDPARGAAYGSLGAFEVQRGNPQPAERAFQRAVELDPAAAAPHLALGNFYWGHARWEAAEQELLKAVELDPGDARVHQMAANFYMATKRPPQAEPHLKKIVEITNAPAASVALANYYASRRDQEAARAALQPLTEATTTAVLAETQFASLDFRFGARTSGYERLARVLEQDQTNLAALLIRTTALLEDGKLADALQSAQSAVDHHSGSAEALFALGRVQIARRETDAAIATFNEVLARNPRATDAKVALARLHLAAGRADTSVNLAREAASVDGRNLPARLTLVRGLLVSKQLLRAEAELAALIKDAPSDGSVHALSGALSALKGDQLAARARYERALQLDPRSLEGLRGLINLDLAARRTADARARIESRITEEPRNLNALMLAAQTYAATGELPKAESALRQILAVDASFLDAYSALAQVYVRQRRLDAALSEFEQLAERQPRPVAALTFSGIILQAQGQPDRAAERFQRALEIDPEAAVAANNLAWIYATSGDKLEAALQLAQTARRHLPDNPAVINTLGFIYYKKDMLTLAIPELKASVDRVPDNATYNHHLGLAYAKAGDRPRAIQHLRRALQLHGNFDGAAEAGALLRSLDAGQSH